MISVRTVLCLGHGRQRLRSRLPRRHRRHVLDAAVRERREDEAHRIREHDPGLPCVPSNYPGLSDLLEGSGDPGEVQVRPVPGRGPARQGRPSRD